MVKTIGTARVAWSKGASEPPNEDDVWRERYQFRRLFRIFSALPGPP